MGRVLLGQQELLGAIEEMKQETRRLAKRQLTWFGSDKEIRWFDPQQKTASIAAAEKFFSK
jgi:tRNA A37 N6-isopentenylltransferase MiaA